VVRYHFRAIIYRFLTVIDLFQVVIWHFLRVLSNFWAVN
jgi:hypothetical protein